MKEEEEETVEDADHNTSRRSIIFNVFMYKCIRLNEK